jgi:hypothetical protein
MKSADTARSTSRRSTCALAPVRPNQSGIGIALDCIQPIMSGRHNGSRPASLCRYSTRRSWRHARSGIPISEWVAGNPYSPGLHGKETLESGKVL